MTIGGIYYFPPFCIWGTLLQPQTEYGTLWNPRELEGIEVFFQICGILWNGIQIRKHFNRNQRYTHDGSMELLYMMCHGSHQHTPVIFFAYIAYMDLGKL